MYVDVNIFEEFAKSGSLLPLDAYMKDFAWKDIPQPLIDGFAYNKRIYGVAKEFSSVSDLLYLIFQVRGLSSLPFR